MNDGHRRNKPPFQIDPDPQNNAAETASGPPGAEYTKDRSPFGYDRFDLRAAQIKGSSTLSPAAVDAVLAKMAGNDLGPELFSQREQRQIGG